MGPQRFEQLRVEQFGVMSENVYFFSLFYLKRPADFFVIDRAM